MNIKEQLKTIDLDFSEVDVNEAIRVQALLKKLRKHWYMRFILLLLFSCLQVVLVLFGVVPFGIVPLALSIIPFLEIYRMWPLSGRIYLCEYLYNLIYGDSIIKLKEESKKKFTNT